MTSEWRMRAMKYLRDNPEVAASVTTRLLDDFCMGDYVMTMKEFDEYLDAEGGRSAFWHYGKFRGGVSEKDAWVYVETDYDNNYKPLRVEGIHNDGHAGTRFVKILDSMGFLEDIESGHIEDDYLPEQIRPRAMSPSAKRSTAARKPAAKRKAPQRANGTSKARKAATGRPNAKRRTGGRR